MPIASLHDILSDARQGFYGVPYCESWNLESAQAVVDAAEKVRSPAIVGFNGGFLQHPSRRQPENLAWYAGLRLALESATVPVALLLNESTTVSQIAEAIRLGFNGVMPENEGLSLDEYRSLVKEVVALAHPRGVWVEAQIGTLPAGHACTRVQRANDQSGYGGSVCCRDRGGRAGSLDRQCARHDQRQSVARSRCAEPHSRRGGCAPGGPRWYQSDACEPRKMVGLGVAKINFGTVLKQAYLEAVRERLACYHPPSNPHLYLGMGGEEDIMTAGREVVQRKAEELMEICGSTGRVAYDFKPAV